MTGDAGINLVALKAVLATGHVEWRKHALQRMAQRNIGRAAVLDVLQRADIIEEYSEGRPFPSALFLGFGGGRPLHVVAALDEMSSTVMIVTVYEPDSRYFADGFRTRKQP